MSKLVLCLCTTCFLNSALKPGSFPDSSVGKESTCKPEDPSSIPGSGRSSGEGIGYLLPYSLAFLVAQLVKNLPTMQETWVRSRVGQIAGEGKGCPLQYSGLENSMDYSPWGHNESDMTVFHFHFETRKRVTKYTRSLNSSLYSCFHNFFGF